MPKPRDALGRPVDVLTTDVVFALDHSRPAATRRDVVLNVSGLLWHPGPHVDASAYRRTVADVYRRPAAGGAPVSLLAHVLPIATGPTTTCRRCASSHAEHAPDAEILCPPSSTEIRGVLAGARLVIGSRMHACLNALSVGTPALPLAYSRKFAPLMADLGWSHVPRPADAADQAARGSLELADATTCSQRSTRCWSGRTPLDQAAGRLGGLAGRRRHTAADQERLDRAIRRVVAARTAPAAAPAPCSTPGSRCSWTTTGSPSRAACALARPSPEQPGLRRCVPAGGLTPPGPPGRSATRPWGRWSALGGVGRRPRRPPPRQQRRGLTALVGWLVEAGEVSAVGSRQGSHRAAADRGHLDHRVRAGARPPPVPAMHH